MKKVIRKIATFADLYLAFFFSLFFKKGKSGILLIPAADLCGGFGEDIMIGSFLKRYEKQKVDFIVGKSYNKDYLSGNVQYVILNKLFCLTRLVLIMKSYSELHVIGADIMDGFHTTGTNRFNSLFLAHRMGLKVNLTGLSIRETVPDYVKKQFLKFSRFGIVKARDLESYNRLSQFIPSDRLLLVSDLAFLCPDNNIYPSSYEKTKEWVIDRRLHKQIIVAFCPNSIQMKSLGKEKYYHMMKKNIDILLKCNCSILLLYHDLRRYALNTSDKDISEDLIKKFDKLDNIFYVDDINDGITLKKYLSLCDFTFTGRMHFGISGYVCGKVMFGISYLNKFEGLQKMFGLNKGINTLFDYSNIKNEDETIRLFVHNIKQLSEVVDKKLPIVKQLAEKNFSSF